MKKPFSLDIKPDVARKMTRKEYYAARSWVRCVNRELLKRMNIFHQNK